VQEVPKSKFLSVSGAEPPVVKKDWKLVVIDATSTNTCAFLKK